MSYVEANAMNHCCGVVEIGNLGGDDLKELRAQILSRLKEFGPHMAYNHSNEQQEVGAGMAVATTIPYQTAARRALRLCKFRPRYSFRNPNTGTRVTFWVRKLTR